MEARSFAFSVEGIESLRLVIRRGNLALCYVAQVMTFEVLSSVLLAIPGIDMTENKRTMNID